MRKTKITIIQEDNSDFPTVILSSIFYIYSLSSFHKAQLAEICANYRPRLTVKEDLASRKITREDYRLDGTMFTENSSRR